MGKILLTNGFRGRLTGERFIPPGTYAEDDPALFGAGEQLVQAGIAQRESRPVSVAPSAPPLQPKAPQRGKSKPSVKGG